MRVYTTTQDSAHKTRRRVKIVAKVYSTAARARGIIPMDERAVRNSLPLFLSYRELTLEARAHVYSFFLLVLLFIGRSIVEFSCPERALFGKESGELIRSVRGKTRNDEVYVCGLGVVASFKFMGGSGVERVSGSFGDRWYKDNKNCGCEKKLIVKRINYFILLQFYLS